jgi:SAM-dependent methyltransferase
VPKAVPRRVRSRVFGRDPGAYDRARLAYPERVYEILTTRCGLRPGASVFEIGPGTGIASRELLRRGAGPLTLIEPDWRLARYLADSLRPWEDRVKVSIRPFERAVLAPGDFDLGVAATSFHWLPERRSLRKVAQALRPGGWWATWNSHHGDRSRPSPFHAAMQPLYRETFGGRGIAHGGTRARASARRDREHRLRALRSVGSFDRISSEEIRGTVTLETARVTALWGTFSDIVTLPPKKRDRFLTEMGRIVDEEFGGKVTFPMVTPFYTARRR